VTPATVNQPIQNTGYGKEGKQPQSSQLRRQSSSRSETANISAPGQRKKTPKKENQEILSLLLKGHAANASIASEMHKCNKD
jgi:DNA-binding NarL/FixJ family response regulator